MPKAPKLRLDKQQINEIAQQLECGFDCYVHKQTGELISLPNVDTFMDMDEELWEEDRNMVNDNADQFLSIQPPESRDSFNYMQEFAEEIVTSEEVSSRLLRALNQHHPFRFFKYEIDNSGEWREKWFQFKTAQFEKWVIEQINNSEELD